VIVKATGAGAVRGAGAGSVRGTAKTTFTNYSDGRFTVWNANQDVVVDNDSGIMWTRNANIDGQKDWTNAVNYCDNLTNATYTDWRLPSITELSRDATEGSTTGLIDAYSSAREVALPLGHPFASAEGNTFWASTTSTNDAAYAWTASVYEGHANTDPKVNGQRVWPCRGP